jgi:uncharacterized protein YaaQ
MSMSNNFVKTNVPGFVKDINTGFIINTNMDELRTIKTAVKHAKDRKHTVEKMKNLEDEVTQLKNLVSQLLERK